MNKPNIKKTNASLTTSTSMVILSTTCCALPILLVTLGLGGAFASLVSTLPWLITLSKYKTMTFAVTAFLLGYSWFQIRRVSQCSIAEAKRLKWQRRILWFSIALLAVSIFAAYGLLPLVKWLEL